MEGPIPIGIFKERIGMFAGGLVSTRVRDRKRRTAAVRRAAVLVSNQERLVKTALISRNDPKLFFILILNSRKLEGYSLEKS